MLYPTYRTEPAPTLPHKVDVARWLAIMRNSFDSFAYLYHLCELGMRIASGLRHSRKTSDLFDSWGPHSFGINSIDGWE